LNYPPAPDSKAVPDETRSNPLPSAESTRPKHHRYRHEMRADRRLAWTRRICILLSVAFLVATAWMVLSQPAQNSVSDAASAPAAAVSSRSPLAHVSNAASGPLSSPVKDPAN
jgi:hypothetical protein